MKTFPVFPVLINIIYTTFYQKKLDFIYLKNINTNIKTIKIAIYFINKKRNHLEDS